MTTGASLVAFARRHRATLALLGLYAALSAAWSLAGGAFRVFPDLWQLLPWPALLEDLGGSLLDLHAQPPLLNLLFGLALRTALWAGTTVETLLLPLYLAAGTVTLTALSAVAHRMVPRPGPRWAALLLVVLNPYFHAVHHYLFYTAWELLFLSLSALLAMRWLERPAPARLAAALTPALLLVCTRSLFHPLWLLALVGLLLWLGRSAVRVRWRSHGAVVACALLLTAAWPLKNLQRFGFFGLSSWSGLSIARGLPTGEPLLPSGYPARLAAFARASGQPPDPRAAAAAQRLVPPAFHGSPALAALAKPDGSPNWNHYALIPISRDLGASAREHLLREPSLLAWKALDFYLNGYAIYEARWPYRNGLAPEMTTGATWARAYELILFQPFRSYDPTRTRLTTGFAMVFPAIVAAALALLWRRRRRWEAGERAAALMLLTILWVLALVLFVDGPEGNRVRYCTEPFLFLVTAWVLGAAGTVRPDRPAV